MKEIACDCILYLEVEDGMSAEDALEHLMMHLDVDVEMSVYNYELRDI